MITLAPLEEEDEKEEDRDGAVPPGELGKGMRLALACPRNALSLCSCDHFLCPPYASSFVILYWPIAKESQYGGKVPHGSAEDCWAATE